MARFFANVRYPLIPNPHQRQTMFEQYIEDPDHVMDKVFLDDETYTKAIEAFIIVCTDAVIIDPVRRTFHLAKRRSKPAADVWWVIGGRRQAGEDPLHGIRRNFRRETGLDIGSEHFQMRCIFDMRWRDRRQAPQGKGSHNLSYTYSACLTPEQIRFASAHLEPREYYAELGLVEFDRERIMREGHPVIRALYDKVFPDIQRSM